MDPQAKDRSITSSETLPTAEVSIIMPMTLETYKKILTTKQTPLLTKLHPSNPPRSPSSPGSLARSSHPQSRQGQAIDDTQSPLSSSSNPDASSTNSPGSLQADRHTQWPLFLRTVLLCGLLNLVADLGGNMTAAPEIRILELSLCRDYYHAHDASIIGPPPWRFVDERHCKIPEVQSRLAQLRGLRAPLSVIPGLLFTVFASSLADVYGRKPLLFWSFTGIFLSYLWPCIVCEWVFLGF